MPVQKSRKTPSRRGMHRSHDGLAKPALSIDPQSGETHLRHRITPDGFYRGKRVIEKPAEAKTGIRPPSFGAGPEGPACCHSPSM